MFRIQGFGDRPPLVAKATSGTARQCRRSFGWSREGAEMIKAIFTIAFGAIACATSAYAQTYPTGRVEIVVGFSPGGGTDTSSRFLAQKLATKWGQPVVIQNKTGAAGNIAAAHVAKARPDGHTLYSGNGALVSMNPIMFKNMGFDVNKDIIPVTLLVTAPSVFAINPSETKTKSFKELIEYARANPGKVRFGTAGIGTPDHLAWGVLVSTTGVDITFVPYKGAAEAYADLLGGRIEIVSSSINTVKPFLESGKLAAIATTGSKRATVLPNVSTVSEHFPAFGDTSTSIAIWTTAGTPPEVVRKMRDDIKSVMESDDAKKFFADNGYTIVVSTPEETKTWLERESKTHAGIAKTIGIEKQ